MRLGAQLEVSRSQQFSSVQLSGRPVGVLRGEGAPADPAESIHQLPIARQRIEQLEQQLEFLQEHLDSLEKVSWLTTSSSCNSCSGTGVV